MKQLHRIVLSCLFASQAMTALAEHENISLEAVEVDAVAIDSRIAKHPATVETFTKEQISDSVNAVTSAHTMKYLPSIQIRERFIGDRNGIIAGRTVGTLSPAQTLLYADGVLLSNLLGNSWSYAPRWGQVSPEEIESVSMMYGPFSALYAGNSFGGVVSINTRMPTEFESHASAQYIYQNYENYGTDSSFTGQHYTASVGNKVDDFAFWLSVDYLDNEGQPMDFAVSDVSSGSGAADGIDVTGAYQDKSERDRDRLIFGARSIESPEQTHIKFKGAYDITSDLRATYTLGLWDLENRRDVESYLTDANGNTVYNTRVNVNGLRYNVRGLSPSESEAFHVMQAFDLKSHTNGFFDWQFTLSDYDYLKDKNNSSNLSTSTTIDGGNPYLNLAGRITDLSGTGWTVAEAKGTLRPENHTIDFGYHIDNYKLRSRQFNSDDWKAGSRDSVRRVSKGETQTQAVYVQDIWQIDPKWSATFGGRLEYWRAMNGESLEQQYDTMTETKFSPKVSISYEPEPAWGFRGSFGQAYRFPTVTELYQRISDGNGIVQNNPQLKPEEVFAAELTAERRFNNGLVRVSLFHENKYDALISQTLAGGSPIPFGTGTCAAASSCTFVQNVGHIRTRGIELSTEWEDVFISGLDVLGSLTLTEAEVLRNEADRSIEGNKPTRIPREMAKFVLTYSPNEALTYSLAGRYSGRQYTRLDNADVNDGTYVAASKFFFVDVKVNYKFKDRFTASLGIDNINNYKAYVRHPYPQRTAYVQLKFDY